MSRQAHDLPLASPGLTSYRYRGRYGWIMIGAQDDADALKQASRSTGMPSTFDNLEVWSAQAFDYVKSGTNVSLTNCF